MALELKLSYTKCVWNARDQFGLFWFNSDSVRFESSKISNFHLETKRNIDTYLENSLVIYKTSIRYIL